MEDPELLRFQDDLKVENREGQSWLFDAVRKKWLVLQPEEIVRQLLVRWLTAEKGYNLNRLSLERGLMFNGLSRRYDLLVYDPQMQPFMLAECKAPHIHLGEEALKQVSTYNMTLKVPYVLLTNGRQSHVFAIDHNARTSQKLKHLPTYPKN